MTEEEKKQFQIQKQEEFFRLCERCLFLAKFQMVIPVLLLVSMIFAIWLIVKGW